MPFTNCFYRPRYQRIPDNHSLHLFWPQERFNYSKFFSTKIHPVRMESWTRAFSSSSTRCCFGTFFLDAVRCWHGCFRAVSLSPCFLFVIQARSWGYRPYWRLFSIYNMLAKCLLLIVLKFFLSFSSFSRACVCAQFTAPAQAIDGRHPAFASSEFYQDPLLPRDCFIGSDMGGRLFLSFAKEFLAYILGKGDIVRNSLVPKLAIYLFGLTGRDDTTFAF